MPVSSLKKALLIIHGIGEQEEFDTLNEFTDGLFQALRRRIQSTLVYGKEVSITNEFRFGARGKRGDGVSLEDLGFASIRLKDLHIDLYEGYWAKLPKKPLFREIISWLFSILIISLFKGRFLVLTLGISLMGLLLLIYLFPFFIFFQLLKYSEIFRISGCLIIFGGVIYLRNKIYIYIKKRIHSRWLNLIGGYVGDIGDYVITLAIAYPLLFYSLKLGEYIKTSLIILICVFISNILRLISGKVRRSTKIRLREIVIAILQYLPFLVPLLVGIYSGYIKVILSITFVIICVIKKFAAYFIFNYAGDVVVYTDDEFKEDKDKINKKIKERLIKRLNEYDKTYVIGHSLGSVIGYDILYELKKEPISKKIKAYLSVGSPLDKIYYFFKKERRTKTSLGLDICWYNFYELIDPIGARLDFYGDIKNIRSCKFWYSPYLAHTGYWQVPEVMNKIIDIIWNDKFT